jgi:hypothetical protein
MDDYPKSLNLQEMKMAPTVGLLIDVNAKHKAETIKPFWDLQEAADVLTWKRGRRAL